MDICAQKQMESTHTRIQIWLIDQAQRQVLMQKIVLKPPSIHLWFRTKKSDNYRGPHLRQTSTHFQLD